MTFWWQELDTLICNPPNLPSDASKRPKHESDNPPLTKRLLDLPLLPGWCHACGPTALLPAVVQWWNWERPLPEFQGFNQQRQTQQKSTKRKPCIVHLPSLYLFTSSIPCNQCNLCSNPWFYDDLCQGSARPYLARTVFSVSAVNVRRNASETPGNCTTAFGGMKSYSETGRSFILRHRRLHTCVPKNFLTPSSLRSPSPKDS